MSYGKEKYFVKTLTLCHINFFPIYPKLIRGALCLQFRKCQFELIL